VTSLEAFIKTLSRVVGVLVLTGEAPHLVPEMNRIGFGRK
jgi:hypothetical protein